MCHDPRISNHFSCCKVVKKQEKCFSTTLQVEICLIFLWRGTLIRDMSHWYVWHDSIMYVTWLIHSGREVHLMHEWVMSHISINHVTYQCVMSHISMSHITHVHEPCHVSMCHVTHINHTSSCKVYRGKRSASHVWVSHVTHINESCHISMRIMSHLTTTRRDAQSGEVLLTHISTYQWAMSHINASRHTYQWVTSHKSTSHVAHINASRHTYQ